MGVTVDGVDVQVTQDLNKQDVIFYAQVLTGSTTITPTSGKRMKVVKAQVLQKPDNSTFNLVTLSFTSTGNFVTGWVYSDSSECTGDVNEALTITLSTTDPVSVNIRYKEY